jgi:hypothetical protein
MYAGVPITVPATVAPALELAFDRCDSESPLSARAGGSLSWASRSLARPQSITTVSP